MSHLLTTKNFARLVSWVQGTGLVYASQKRWNEDGMKSVKVKMKAEKK